MHALDLPNVRTEPGYECIADILKSLAPKKSRNFEQDDASTIDTQGLFNWLTRLVGSDLAWLEDDQKDEIWDLAGKRMAERCGRTAASTRVREMHVDGLDGGAIELVEPALTEDNLGFKTWGSALVIAQRLVREPELLQGRVLEMGSGTGLTAIVAAKLGATIVATDLPEIVDNLRTNIEQNGVDGSASAETLDWSDSTGFVERHGQFDTVMVADPVYSHDHPALVVNTIKHTLKKDGQLVLQLPERAKYEDVRQMLYDMLQEAGLVQTRFDTEPGEDEFGKMDFSFSLWGYA